MLIKFFPERFDPFLIHKKNSRPVRFTGRLIESLINKIYSAYQQYSRDL